MCMSALRHQLFNRVYNLTTHLYCVACKTGYKKPYNQSSKQANSHFNCMEAPLWNKGASKMHSSALTSFYWQEKEERKNPHITQWTILENTHTFNPVTSTCLLCTREKFNIIYKSQLCSLNSRNEIYNHCRHKKMKLICNYKKWKLIQWLRSIILQQKL